MTRPEGGPDPGRSARPGRPNPAGGDAGDRQDAQALAGLVAMFSITAAWWALALWPVENGPEWLERTRYVCFGVAESGLPDTTGWIGLIGAPLGMFSILVVGWRRGLQRLLRRARTSPVVAATLASLAFGCVLLVAGAGMRVQQAPAAEAWLTEEAPLPPETYPRLDRDPPPLALTGQHGQVVRLDELAGRPVLVTFAFAHCSTICPAIVAQALAAQDALHGSEHHPRLLVVTLDPWRDTPSRLPGMAASWGFPDEDAWVLSGTVEDVEAALDAWDIPRSRDLTTGEVTHPSLVYLVDPDGRLAYASNGGTAALVSLLRRL